MGELSDLLSRVEQASEGDTDLDRDVAIAIGWLPPVHGLSHWHDPEGNHWTALPDWSTSVDDALALVGRMLPGGKVQLFQSFPMEPDDVQEWGARLTSVRRTTYSSFEFYGEDEHIRRQATPALALLAALLRALISEPSDG